MGRSRGVFHADEDPTQRSVLLSFATLAHSLQTTDARNPISLQLVS